MKRLKKAHKRSRSQEAMMGSANPAPKMEAPSVSMINARGGEEARFVK